MARLIIKLLGPFQATLDGQPVAGFDSDKVRALLSYLIVEVDRPQRRESLAGLLWPERPETSARTNLRRALANLRQVIGDRRAEPPFLLISRQTIQFNGAADYQLDVQEFSQLAVAGIGTPAEIEGLEQAANLYQGPFLAGFSLADAPEFEDWQRLNGQAFQGQAMGVMQRLAAYYENLGLFNRALPFARRLLELEPWDEEGHRQVMRLLALSGRRSQALAQYEECRQELREELDLEPDPETQALYENILTGQLDQEYSRAADRPIRGYEVLERLGGGTFGVVYRAYQPAVKRDVAIKIIRPELANQPDFIRRFEVEAQLVARLEHPHIVPLYDYWREPGGAYLVMRWLKAGNLHEALSHGPWNLEPAADLLDQIASALDVAHRQGIIHRDIKPANILLDETGNAYLSDFGIATLTDTVSLPGLDFAVQGGSQLSGSPDYISPEQLQDQPLTPQADVYCLGLVLFVMLTGQHPFQDTAYDLMPARHLADPLPSACELRPGLPEVVDAIIQKATAKDPACRYDGALSLAASFRAAISTGRAESLPEPVAGRDFWEVANPYKGLRAFTEADAAVFFGREALTQSLLDRLAASRSEGCSRFLAVAGPSGSGKSSVVKASVLPGLRRGVIPGSEHWYYVDMVPGSHPYEELEIALLRIAVNPPPTLLDQLQDGERGLLRAARRILPSKDDRLVLLIDQFEELFTVVDNPSVTARFLESLLVAATDPRSPITVIITIRADFYDRPLNYAAFGEMMRDHTEWIMPMTAEELGRAITGPAIKVGLRVEPELVPVLVADVHDQPGGLPLLQFALAELYEGREKGLLTMAAYQEMGGVMGALGRRAEDIFTGLDDAGQEVARRLFLRLVTLGEGTEDTRRRVRRSGLVPITDNQLPIEGSQLSTDGLPASAVIDAYGKARLLTFDRDPVTREQTVEMAHESLIREWPRLGGWLADDREGLRLHRQLAQAAQGWQNLEWDEGALYRGTRLAQAVEWAEEHKGRLSPLERQFLEASQDLVRRKEAEREAQRQRELESVRQLAEAEKRRAEEQTYASEQLRKGRRALVGALVIATLLAIFAIFFGFRFRQSAADARRENRIALARQLAAQSDAAIETDPELSLLLAVEAVNTTFKKDGFTTFEAEKVLFRALTLPVRSVLHGHTDQVLRASFSPDGRLIVTASLDGTARLWDEGGNNMATLVGHEGAVLSADFSPDGKRVVTAGRDGTARLWETDGTLITVLEGHAASVWEAVFSPDGKRILTVSADRTARLWNVDGRLIVALEGHQAGILDGLFSPDGRRMLTTSDDGTARLWNADGHPITTLDGHSGSIGWADFSPDGSHILTASIDGTARLWDADGNIITTLEEHTGFVYSAVFCPDGERLLTASADGTARLWNVSGEVLAILQGHTAGVIQARFSPDGKRIVTASGDRTARLWDANGHLISTLKGHTAEVIDVHFSPDGSRLLTAGADGTAWLWDIGGPFITNLFDEWVQQARCRPDGKRILTTGILSARLWDDSGRLLKTLEHGGFVFMADFSPDGRRIVTASDDGMARLWDGDGNLLAVLEGHEGPVRLAIFNPEGNRIVTTGDDGIVRIWEADGSFLAALDGHGGPIRLAVFNPDSTRLVTAGLYGAPRLWDVSAGFDNGAESIPMGELAGDFPGIESVAFSPDGRQIATAGSDGSIWLWDADGEFISKIESHRQSVLRVSFNPDGTRILSASIDGTARLWDATGNFIKILAAHTGAVSWAGFSPDGRRIATASQDGTARLWDASGDLLTVLEGHTGPLLWASFSPDGTHLLTAGEDGSVRTWENWSGIDAMLVEARKRGIRTLTEAECQQYLHADTCPATP